MPTLRKAVPKKRIANRKTTVLKKTPPKRTTAVKRKPVAKRRKPALTGSQRGSVKRLALPKLLSKKVSKKNKTFLLFAVIFAGIGAYLVIQSFAATVTLAVLEAESMTGQNTEIVADNTASGSKNVLFKYNGETNGQVSFTAAASQITVRAKGAQCQGAPQMVIKIDGVVKQTSSVSSTGWSDYSTTQSISAGSHSVTVGFTNDYNYTHKNARKSCDRNLYVDKVTFYGTTAEPPVSSNSVSILVPGNGTTVTGGVPVEAKPTMANGVSKVEFYLDGALNKTEGLAPYCMAGDNNGPPCWNWDSKTVANGSHTIKVIAYDTAATPNKAEASVTFNVSNTTTSTPPPTPPITGKTLVFEDNFDGTAVNTNNWSFYVSPGHSGNGLRRASAFSVANGILDVTAIWDGTNIVSGGMAHRTNYTYGTFEAKVRTDPDPTGQTSGVILTWPQAEGWPYNGENDFYETGTNRTRNPFKSYIHHYRATSGGDQTVITHYADATQWHVMRMDWTPEAISIYRDGVFIGALTDPAKIVNIPHHLSIQLDAFANGPLQGPVKMQVDWIRVYK